MYCKNCGYENDDDASFCENCGANLRPTYYEKPSLGMSTTNKILIVVVIVLIAGISIAAGMLLMSKAPVNNTTNNVSVNEKNNTSDVQTNVPASNGPQLIDSNTITGDSSLYGHFSYEWKTYKNTDYNLVIYSTFTNDQQNNLKQTGTLSIGEPGFVDITVEPKASGKSSWMNRGSIQGYSTVVEYYWGYFRQQYLMKGPIH